MTFHHTAPATIDLLLSQSRINNITVASLEKRFAVKNASGSSFAGTFYYNNENEFLDKSNQVVTTGTEENRLVVYFRNDTAKFITADQFSDPILEVENAGEWEQWIFIQPRVASQSVWETKSKSVRNATVPDVPNSLKDKTRWLQGIIRNSTDFQVRYGTSYLDSGRYDQFPSDTVDAFSLSTFTGCNGDGTVFTGFSGGASYRIDIDQKHSFSFCLGFTSPYAGAYKAAAIAGDIPEAGYEAASKEGGEVRSGMYHAVDKDGVQLVFQLRIAAAAGQRANFNIEEIRYYN